MDIPGCTDMRVRAGSQRWHAIRRSGIGASEIAATVGLSPYMSATTLYYRKRGDLPEQFDTARMEWGRRLERTILAKFKERHPELGPYQTGKLYRSDERPWQLATPDAVTWLGSEPVVVEIKTGASRDKWGDEGTDDIPVEYRCQIMQSMDVVGARLAYLPVLFNGRDYREYVIRYDWTDVRILRIRGAAFWERVVGGDPPPVDGHPETTSALRKLWGVEDKIVTIPYDLAQKRERAGAALDRAVEFFERIDNQVRDLVGDAAEVYANGRVVAKRSQWTQLDLDRTKLRKEHPELWDAAAYGVESRRTRFTWKGLHD